jgi:hypothetical protein
LDKQSSKYVISKFLIFENHPMEIPPSLTTFSKSRLKNNCFDILYHFILILGTCR